MAMLYIDGTALSVAVSVIHIQYSGLRQLSPACLSVVLSGG